MTITTSINAAPRRDCPACGAHLPRPTPRRCPACDAALGSAPALSAPGPAQTVSRVNPGDATVATESANSPLLDETTDDPLARTTAVATNPETVTIQIGHGDSVVYLPDDTDGDASRTTNVPTSVVGPRASLSHIGLEGGVTLEQPAPVPEREHTGGTTTLPTARNEAPASVNEVLSQRPGEEKYVVAGEIARGGMGVILRAVDRDIRRDVAMKILLSDVKDRSRERFVEEAQITGQLEHPNIVPVHDLGVDADGRLFFTMKLVKGKSLAEILDAQRTPAVAALVADDPDAVPEYSLGRLLTTYLSMLNAIAFAHDRGVIHRDLKPGNVMVGDFGEVLVMDWGLAKVAVGRTGSAKQWTHAHVRATTLGQLAAGRGKGRQPLVLPDPGRALATDERLKTLVEAFASQHEEIEGRTIEGTPAYMPPEQARGELAEIDERSDIYALGAILYEILTLSPPVRGRSVRAILDEVVAGRIPVPEMRAPERTIPPELSAIAMKALAADKTNRYQTVLELRRDIELYLDDRQVSAKEDSTYEALVKLVRRNQEVVTAISVCVLIVVAVTILLFNAILKERGKYQQSAREAQTRLGELRSEQDKRAQDQRRAAPALVAKAQRSLDQKLFAESRTDVDLAIQYDPALAEARLLAAQLAIRDQDWATAVAQLTAFTAAQPTDADGKQLLDLVQQAAVPGSTATSRGSSAHLTQIADVLVRQGAFTIAESLYQSGTDLVLLYRVRLEKQWPGCTRVGFSADKNGQLRLDGLAGRPDVSDLSALDGMPVARLNISHTKVFDLAPLKRMPLTALDLTDTPVRNLEPLAGLPLTSLLVANTRIDDLSPLNQAVLDELDCSDTAVADLTPIERMPLTTLRLARTRVSDLAVVTGMPLTTLSVAGTHLSDLAPLKGLKLVDLDATNTQVADLRPLAEMRLTALRLANTKVNDLSQLKGMPLTTLTITGTAVADLTPLAGMPLTALDLSGLPITDLGPLSGMPLASLDLRRTPVTSISALTDAKLSSLVLADTRITDLTPLASMPLTNLDLSGTPVTDLAPLANLPLTSLALDGAPISDLRPLVKLPLKELRLTGTHVTDVRPLGPDTIPGKSLERLILPPNCDKGLDQLRQLPTLKQVGRMWEGSWNRVPPAVDFWRRQLREPAH